MRSIFGFTQKPAKSTLPSEWLYARLSFAALETWETKAYDSDLVLQGMTQKFKAERSPRNVGDPGVALLLP